MIVNLFGLQSFYNKLRPQDRPLFLVELFFVGRFSPGRYSVLWISIGLFLTWLFGIVGFVLTFGVIFTWYCCYFLLLLSFLYKWKKKHLNTKE